MPRAFRSDPAARKRARPAECAQVGHSVSRAQHGVSPNEPPAHSVAPVLGYPPRARLLRRRATAPAANSSFATTAAAMHEMRDRLYRSDRKHSNRSLERIET
eukprot:1180528-Prorocentrum_minimum.AAC.1